MRIDPGQVCAFVQIAVDAGKREVLEIISPAVYLRHNVLNVKCRKRRIVLMQAAILASVVSALSNL